MMKKLLSVILCTVLCFTTQTILSAKTTDQNSISLKYVNVTSVSAALSFSGSNAVISGAVNGKAGVTQISVETRLQRRDGSGWVSIESWSDSTNSRNIFISESASASAGYTYRVRIDVTAYAGGTSESITQYSKEVSH